MSAIATQQAKKVESNETWTSVISSASKSEQKSLIFIKKMLAIALSNITYLRAMFPETCYSVKILEGMTVKILKNGRNAGVSRLLQWIEGCYDAIEKKYLRQLMFAIYTNPEKSDVLLESYTFRFSYDKNPLFNVSANGDSVEVSYSAEQTLKASSSLIRTLILLMQNVQSLPDNVMVTMQLLYYDDVTPPDYEPKGFTAAETDKVSYQVDTINIKIGEVSTPFHTFKLRVKTDANQFKDDVETASISENNLENAEDPGLCDTLEISDLTDKAINMSISCPNPVVSSASASSSKIEFKNADNFGKRKYTLDNVIEGKLSKNNCFTAGGLENLLLEVSGSDTSAPPSQTESVNELRKSSKKSKRIKVSHPEKRLAV